MELTDHDQAKLDGMRVKRFTELFPILKRATLLLSGMDRTLILSCPPHIIKQVQKRWFDLRLQAWFVLAADQISLYCGGNLVQTACTLPKLLEAKISSDDCVSPTLRENEPGEPMVTTKERPTTKSTAKSTAKSTPRKRSQSGQATNAAAAAISTIPVLQNLSNLATKTGIPVEQIAQEILESKFMVFQDDGIFKAEEKGISAWVDSWLDRERDQRKAELLGTSPAVENGKTATSTATTEPKKTVARKPSAKKPTQTVQVPGIPKTFKSFKKSSSHSRTIDAFLTAQGWTGDNPIRVEVIEGIANLPMDGMPDRDSQSLAERSLARILRVYPSASRKTVYKNLIQAAKEMTGTASKPTEAAQAETN